MKDFWEKNQTRIVPWLFLMPALIMFSVYVIYPILQSFALSFRDWDGLSPDKVFVGLDNYRELFDDDVFWVSIKNNMIWVIFYLLAPPIGLAIALFLNQQGKIMRLVKSLFFFPFVISQIVVGLVFTWFYDPSFGLLNKILMGIGLVSEPIALLSSETGVTWAIIAAGLWPQIAYCMILYLTGLNAVNKSLIEAAEIDGCTGFKALWYIILPQLRPATFIAIVVTVIGSLRSFDLIAIMTQGGPYDSSSVLAFFMYEQSITNYRMGYGAAIATILFLIMSVYIAYFLIRLLNQEKVRK
ncbi:MAG: sugar ABC transporter permease [Desulfobacterales bacterium]|nr:sugar ABC transporter permease [Desulfobacterales bacterium]